MCHPPTGNSGVCLGITALSEAVKRPQYTKKFQHIIFTHVLVWTWGVIFFSVKSPSPSCHYCDWSWHLEYIYVSLKKEIFLIYHYSLAKQWGTRVQEVIMNADRQLWVLSENEHKSIGACGWKEREKINSLPKQAKCVQMLFAHDTLMYKRIHLAWRCAGNDLCLTLYSVWKK